MPEWLGSGLQNRVRRFNSGSRLKKSKMKNLKPKISHFKREEILKRLIAKDNLDDKNALPELNSKPNQLKYKSAVSQALAKKVRRDTARIIFLVVLSILIIFGLYFADKKTGVLIKGAQKITQFLHI